MIEIQKNRTHVDFKLKLKNNAGDFDDLKFERIEPLTPELSTARSFEHSVFMNQRFSQGTD